MTIKRFLIHLLAMAGVILIVLLGVMLWLRIYTNHGQKLELPDYKNISVEEARIDARKKSFELIVNDSLFRVGTPGGIILNQNPEAGSKVKENRKVYIDISRYNATQNRLGDLPFMYGREYQSVKRSLSHLEINSEVKSYSYDAGEPDHILEVWYRGKRIDGNEGRQDDVEIATGDKLEFVLSKKEGGEVPVPNLVCERLGIARWKLQTSRLKLGRIEKRGIVPANLDSAYIVQQMPIYTDSSKIAMGEVIHVLVQGELPEDCQ
ncbi:MAG: PASTA domain-containing protein [Saprospiraceae bacterium]|jgi:hypothetical protein